MTRKTKLLFKKCWVWPKDAEIKIKALMQGFSLHVCSGESDLGDVKLDLRGTVDVRGSMLFLPFKPGTFDTVVCDPPWELSYSVRSRLLYQLRDSLKPGGRLIFKSMWFPKVRGIELIEVWACFPAAFSNQNASFLILGVRSALA